MSTRTHRRRTLGRILVLAVSATATVFGVGSPARATGADPGGGNLGTNLGAVTYYDGVVPFADLVDQAGDWVPQRTGGTWGTGDPLDLRRDGWPARLAPGQYATAVLAEVRYPAGEYTVSWSGVGTFDVAGTRFTTAAGARSGTGTVRLDGSSIALLDLRATDPADPLRAIAVRVPGAAPGATFRSAYLAQLAPYRVLRFMDWQRTNSTFADPPRSFTCATRTLPDSSSQGTAGGVSVERMVELANTVHADPWFTIPHEATDDWISCHARIVATTLDRGLTPRYEFSNETWNPAFTAFHVLRQEGVERGLGAGDAYLGLQQRVAQRHVAAMALVSAEFAAAQRRVVRVLAGQAANAWVLDQRLSGAATATDEVAIAPYLHVHGLDPFDPADAAVVAGWTDGRLFGDLATAQTADVDAWTAAHVSLARSWGKTLVAYEGGQHLVGDPGNDALTARFTGANRAAGMGTTYRTYLDHWRAATGNALFVHFTDVGPASRWGSWGALETPEASTSPKYAALVAWAAGSPNPTTTTTRPPTPTTTTRPPTPTTTRPATPRFRPVSPPIRVLDSRPATSVGGYRTPWEGGTVRTVTVTGRSGVPAGTTAVKITVTATRAGGAGALTVWPAGRTRPGSPTLSFAPGADATRTVTVPLPADGRLAVHASARTDVVMSVSGAYA